MKKKKRKNKIPRNITFNDIQPGDVVEFYDYGFRYDIVKSITKKRKYKSEKDRYVVNTERYGKVLIGKIKNVLVYEDGKTVEKPLVGDLFE